MNSEIQSETFLEKKKRIESAACRGMLSAWSGLNGTAIYSKPYNAQEVFSVYAVANGCSFEETMQKAARSLLAEWSRANSDEFAPSENLVSVAVELIDKIVEEQKS